MWKQSFHRNFLVMANVTLAPTTVQGFVILLLILTHLWGCSCDQMTPIPRSVIVIRCKEVQ